MSRFRLFGRAAEGPWTAVGTPGGPATAAARPVQPGGAEDTDPFGITALTAGQISPAGWGLAANGGFPAATAAAGTAASWVPADYRTPRSDAGYSAVPTQGHPGAGSGVPAPGPATAGPDAAARTPFPHPVFPTGAAPTGPGTADGAWATSGDPTPPLVAAAVPAPHETRPPAAIGPALGSALDPALDPAEAGALAAAFAADYLSWDQDDPTRRGAVLAEYLAGPPSASRLGWSGHGRQRVEISLPGRVRPDGEGRLLVDVRVRVTPYRRVGGPVDSPVQAPPDIPGAAATAPPPTARGWRGLSSSWIRLSVPVALEGDRLVVDVDEETLDEPLEVAATAGAVEPDDADGHVLDDDRGPYGDPR